MGKLPLILAGLLLLAAAANLVQHQKITSLRAELEHVSAVVDGLEETVKSKDDVLDRYELAAKAERDITAVKQKALTDAAARADALAAELAKTRRAMRAKEESDNAIPECQKLLDSNMAVCPNVVDGVRQRAARGL